MKRFFFKFSDRVADKVTLNKEESRHISRVLRLRLQTKIELLDGEGTIYDAEIVALGKKVVAQIISARKVEQQATQIWLGQAVIKTKKMELLLQKCTELGVANFYAFTSSRCQRHLVDQCRQKQDRWQKIMEESCKQCCRPHPMILHNIRDFDQVVEKTPQHAKTLKLLFWENEENQSLGSYHEDLQSFSRVELLFGPEGGFSQDEIKLAQQAGWRCVGLGPRILRAETAVIAGVAIVQHLLGNI